MKKLLLLAFFVSAISKGDAIGFKEIDSSVNNIPTAYSSAAGSQALSGLSYMRNIVIINNSASALLVSLESPTCASTNGDDMAVPASSSAWLDGNVSISRVVCIRSNSGSAISSGKVQVTVW